ncbi:MAG: RluA family pseudouridine synthase, partial [Thermoguttaceae bacterium]|nr:RluA family pseudouridine synthase [Thermoguttaceae bacterium]
TIAPNDPEAKTAQTFFEVDERFRGFSTIRCLPKTGRTHQIRVHLAHVGCPILCDKLYGGRAAITENELAGIVDRAPRSGKNAADSDAADAGPTPILARQALHARKITFEHPTTRETIVVEAPLPPDMTATLEALRKYRAL